MPNLDCVGKCVCFGNCDDRQFTISEVVNNNPICSIHDQPMVSIAVYGQQEFEYECDYCNDDMGDLK